MIRCLLVDDEPLAVQLLDDYIRQTGFLTTVHRCHHALDALDWLSGHAADAVFLDINLPRLSGMELSALLPASPRIVFTTAYAQYAVESYEKNAVDYLLKPITFERFMTAALKLRQACGDLPAPPAEPDFLFAKTGRNLVKVRFDELLFVEGWKDYVALHTASSGRHLVHRRMKDMEALLPPHFLRVHLSFIVNLREVQRFEDGQLCIGARTVPVSDKYREAFLAAVRGRVV